MPIFYFWLQVLSTNSHLLPIVILSLSHIPLTIHLHITLFLLSHVAQPYLGFHSETSGFHQNLTVSWWALNFSRKRDRHYPICQIGYKKCISFLKNLNFKLHTEKNCLFSCMWNNGLEVGTSSMHISSESKACRVWAKDWFYDKHGREYKSKRSWRR